MWLIILCLLQANLLGMDIEPASDLLAQPLDSNTI